MNNDIVVKQKTDASADQPVVHSLDVKQPPQAVTPATSEQPAAPSAKAAPAGQVAQPLQVDETVEDAQKSNQPIGVIIAAIFIAVCLIAVAIYIGYNQS